MTRTHKKNWMKNAPALVGIAAVALLLAAPMVAAASDSQQERQVPRRKDADAAPESGRGRGQWDAFELRFNGTGLSRDNETYTFQLDAVGLARFRLDKDGNLSAVRGIARVDGQLWDANGTLVKDANFRVHVHLRVTEASEMRWHLESVKKRSGFSAFELRGNATMSELPEILVEGAGHAVVRGIGSDERATPLKLEGAGCFVRL